METTTRSKVTIYQVAAEAGVSISTVSKVLANKAGIRTATRTRVNEAVERLGYSPNLMARGLMRGQTGIIGLLFPYIAEQLLIDPHLLRVIQGIEETLNERDYNLLLATSKDTLNPASSFERLLRGHYFDGAIIIETSEIYGMDLHKLLEQQNRPWVLMGYPAGLLRCYAVYADEFMGGQLVADHLLSLGHQRIGLINARPQPSGVGERVRGFQKVLDAHQIILDESLVAFGNFQEESGYRAAPLLLQRPDPPSAIFAINDRMALGVMHWAHENGLRIPEDFSIIGFDDIPAAATSHPALTTVCQPAVEIGRETMRLLFRLLEGEKPPSHIIVGTELICRSTTAPLKASGLLAS